MEDKIEWNQDTFKEKRLTLVEDFRTADWVEIIPYPELVYQKALTFLQNYTIN